MKRAKTVRQTQIATAAARGAAHFRNGRPCMPALDDGTMQMVKDRLPGHTPDGEASSVDIMDAWINAWTNLNETSKRLTPIG